MELSKIMELTHVPMEVLEQVEEVCITKIKVLEVAADTLVEQQGMMVILAHLVMHMVEEVDLTTPEPIMITNQV